MELSTLTNLLSDPKTLIEKIRTARPDEDIPSIQPEDHEVMNPQERKKREIKVDTGFVDDKNEPIMRTEFEEVTRIPSAIEKNIIDWAAQMAAGVPVDYHALPETDQEEMLYNMFKHTVKSNKLEYLDKTVVRLMGTYKRCAEVWFSEDCDQFHWAPLGAFKKRMRMMLLSKETGDKLFLVTNNVGDAIALTREYIIKDEEDKDIEMFDIWINGAYITFTNNGSDWEQTGNVPQNYGKASFVYYSQDRLEYQDIIQKRKRLETLDSDHADQNIATGSPILVASGLLGMGKRGETGKTFEVTEGGDLKMLEAAGTPESLKMERENLLNGIYYDTNTPNMSIFDGEGIGSNLPIIGIKIRFLPATLKAMNKQSGSWGMGVQRRCNFLKAALCQINTSIKVAQGLDISPRFQVYLPSNETEEYNNIIALVSAGLLSTRAAVTKLGLVDNIEEEMAAIEKEVAARAENNSATK
ncbi:phage portal protein [Pedobacter sp. AW1-32]|uniref:phage portal protein n=1 Tax=Pedobacter sp. AW1-32 TaxID=3383026 RepID=UPI003FEDB318